MQHIPKTPSKLRSPPFSRPSPTKEMIHEYLNWVADSPSLHTLSRTPSRTPSKLQVQTSFHDTPTKQQFRRGLDSISSGSPTDTPSRSPFLGHTPSKVTLDTIYNDPNADVSVISLDGVVYRVSSHHIRRCCRAIGLSVSSDMKKRQRILLPVSSHIAKYFIEMLHQRHHCLPPKASEELDTKNLQSLLELAEDFEAASIASAVNEGLKVKSREDPWGVFGVASRRDDLDLAKEALRGLRGSRLSINDIAEKEFSSYEEIHPLYLAKLFHLLLNRRCTIIKSDPFTAEVISNHNRIRDLILSSPQRRQSRTAPSTPTSTRSRTYQWTISPSKIDWSSSIVPKLGIGEIDWIKLAEDFDPHS